MIYQTELRERLWMLVELITWVDFKNNFRTGNRQDVIYFYPELKKV